MGKHFDTDKSSLEKIRSMTERLNCKERELMIANRRFRAIFDHAPIGMLMTSRRVIIEANETLCEMFGYKPCELIGVSTRILYDTDESYNYVGELLDSDRHEFTCSVVMCHRDGFCQLYTLKVTKLADDENVASIYIELRGE